eukprot:1176767-Prorocentrum_minimum.AAC.4
MAASTMTVTSGNPSKSGFFDASGKFKLYYQTWLPDEEQSAPRAHVLYYTALHESLDVTGVDRLSKSLTQLGTLLSWPDKFVLHQLVQVHPSAERNLRLCSHRLP